MSDSTDRLDDGTARMDTDTAKIGGSQDAGTAGGGTIFADGQTLVLNGKNCVIESLVSMGSGEAVVYKVRMDGKPYVLKHYKPNTPLSDTAKKLLTKIRDNPHERIVKIIDFGSYDGQDFEIMEYAEGGTLDHYLKKTGGIKDRNRLKDMVKQINEGLRQIHGYYKAIYQDLKPENIFFKDGARSSLVLADFGISSVMQGSSDEVEVTASVTDLYAAPELARKGNNTQVIVTPAVDYFALGITVYELWLGEKPFKEIKATTRERRIQNGDVDFPIDMPDDCKTLIQGLIEFKPKDRMGNEQVQKWLSGETLTPDSNKPVTVTGTTYKPLKFGSEFASNPKEMAALMKKYPDAGKVCLYDDFISSNLKEAGDVTLYTEIKNVISDYDKDREAGLTAAIYTLDPETPFISRAGKICKSSEEIADAIMAESAHYMEDLKNLNAALYIYIAITGGSEGKEVALNFCNYFKEYSPWRALTLVYLKLQSDSGITVGSKRYLDADELAQEKDAAQIDLVKKAVREKDSKLLVWLSDIYGDYFKSTDEFGRLNVTEQFFLLGLLPFLSYKELTGKNGETTLKDLIDNYPGRADLFEAYVAQGLPLKGSILDSPVKFTPIDYVVYNLSKKHSADTSGIIFNLIRLLHKLGADVNECSSDGTYPLYNAFNADNDALVNLLLELGADREKYDELVAQRIEKERKETEQRAEQARKDKEEQERRAKQQQEQARIERECQAEKDRIEKAYRAVRKGEEQKKQSKRKTKWVLKQIMKYLLRFGLPVIASIIYALAYKGDTVSHFAMSNSEALIAFAIFLSPLVILHFVPAEINGFTGFLRVISIIFISFLILQGFVWLFAGIDYGWIAFLLIIFALVMALVKPVWKIWDEGGYYEYSQYNDGNMDHADMERYLKEKAHKSKSKKIIALIVASVVLLTAGIIMYNSQKNTLSIPVDVTGIENREYRGKQLVEVKIPDSVTTIGKESFMKNKLSGIEIPASVTSIGDNAFVKNRLTTITIGANVTLGSNVFDADFDEFYTQNGSSAGTYKRPDKKSLNWSAWHGNFKYQYNRGTISITGYNSRGGYLVIPEEISGYPVTIIGKRAFYNTGFANVTIPNSVTSIEEEAFLGGSGKREYNDRGGSSVIPPGTISDVSIGTGVTTIGNNAFEYNKISSIVFPNSVTSIGVSAFANNPVTSVRLGANVQLGDSGDYGALGAGTGFNGAYANNGRRAGTYTRPNTNTTTWTRR